MSNRDFDCVDSLADKQTYGLEAEGRIGRPRPRQEVGKEFSLAQAITLFKKKSDLIR